MKQRALAMVGEGSQVDHSDDEASIALATHPETLDLQLTGILADLGVLVKRHLAAVGYDRDAVHEAVFILELSRQHFRDAIRRSLR